MNRSSKQKKLFLSFLMVVIMPALSQNTNERERIVCPEIRAIVQAVIVSYLLNFVPYEFQSTSCLKTVIHGFAWAVVTYALYERCLKIEKLLTLVQNTHKERVVKPSLNII
ncbi:MAG TPA: hypothetical protein VHA52_01540 [Candidatus Babeliaceae bacterium]|nr:hypothetical protein [Candidatus Babeliaceae bacterium]